MAMAVRAEDIDATIARTRARTGAQDSLRDQAALAATVVRYRARMAVREVGKALGLPEDLTGQLARMTWSWDEEGVTEDRVKELGLTLEDRRLRLTLDLARQLMGTPRHLGQHPGGFILTLDRLDDLRGGDGPPARVDHHERGHDGRHAEDRDLLSIRERQPEGDQEGEDRSHRRRDRRRGDDGLCGGERRLIRRRREVTHGYPSVV